MPNIPQVKAYLKDAEAAAKASEAAASADAEAERSTPPLAPPAALPAAPLSLSDLHSFFGTGALSAYLPDFVADHFESDEVLELIDEELDSVNGKPLAKPARDAFWLRRLLASASPSLVTRYGDRLESLFGSVQAMSALPQADFGSQLRALGFSAVDAQSVENSLAPLRRAVGAASEAVSALHTRAQVAATSVGAVAAEEAAQGAAAVTERVDEEVMRQGAPAWARPAVPQQPPPQRAPAQPEQPVVQQPSIPQAEPEPAEAEAKAEAEAADASPMPRPALSAEEIERLKARFREERSSRRRILASAEPHETARRTWQQDGAPNGLLESLARAPAPAPAPAPVPAKQLVVSKQALAQGAAPSLEEEERVLLLLTERMESERALHAQRRELRIARQNQDTLASALPPLRLTPRSGGQPKPAEAPASCTLQ